MAFRCREIRACDTPLYVTGTHATHTIVCEICTGVATHEASELTA